MRDILNASRAIRTIADGQAAVVNDMAANGVNIFSARSVAIAADEAAKMAMAQKVIVRIATTQ